MYTDIQHSGTYIRFKFTYRRRRPARNIILFCVNKSTAIYCYNNYYYNYIHYYYSIVTVQTRELCEIIIVGSAIANPKRSIEPLAAV